jgi:hypothetical protein
MRAASLIRRSIPWTVLLATACLGPVARAQEGARVPSASARAPAVPSLGDVLVGDAKHDYEAGKALYDGGDYAGALAKFESAARASGDPRLWWDAAACEAGMQHYARASRLMKRYLDSRSPLVGPDAAQTARGFLEETESRTARLDVASNEADAVVFIDDEPVGAAASPSGFRVDTGEHRVRVSKAGFSDYAATLAVASTADVLVTATLHPVVAPVEPRARLAVRAGRRDAIEVDGQLVGLQAWTGLLPVGPHRVRVLAQDSLPFESDVTLGDDESRTMDVTLRPAHRAAGIPAWVWIAGSTVLAAGAITAGYFLFKPESEAASPMGGSLGMAQVP